LTFPVVDTATAIPSPSLCGNLPISLSVVVTSLPHSISRDMCSGGDRWAPRPRFSAATRASILVILRTVRL
jgi:hypothetical protein